jgi:hypothetical protein
VVGANHILKFEDRTQRERAAQSQNALALELPFRPIHRKLGHNHEVYYALFSSGKKERITAL